MSRGPSKAKQILAEAQERVNLAQSRVKDLEGQLGIANVRLFAHQDAYKAFERVLAPTPRKVKDPKSIAQTAGRKSSPKAEAAGNTANTKEPAANALPASEPQTKPGPLCDCGNEETFADHYPNPDSYHVFHAAVKTKHTKHAAGAPA